MRIVRSCRAIAFTLLVAIVLTLFQAGTAFAEPGLWVAKGPRATIYLFGTVHFFRKGENWKSPAMMKAFAASDELWLELPDPGDKAEAQQLIARLGIDSAHPLSSKLSRADLEELDAAAKALGMARGEAALDQMRPWLAAVAIEAGRISHAGFDPTSGIDRLLQHDALAVKKPVKGFETMEQQLNIFAAMSPSLEIQMLESSLRDFADGANKAQALISAWLAGNVDAITHITVDEVKQPFPQLYRTILVARNEAWADRIAAMLKQSGTRFVAVGAAHLAGPDSVQAELARRGVRVERVAEGD